MHRRTVFSAVAALVAGLLPFEALAGSINVLNYSFETPSANTPYTVSTAIDDWTTYGDEPFDTGGGADSSGSGTFVNTGHTGAGYFTNATGNQIAYLFCKSSIPTNHDGLYQVTSAHFAAGQSYTLTVDVGLAGETPDATDPFTLALFEYNPSSPPDPTNPDGLTVKATRTIYNDGTSTATPLSQTVLQTITVSTPILSASDPAVTNNDLIGIEFYTALGSSAATAGNQYDFDNVTLTSTPEPAALSLGGCAVAMVLGGRRRQARY